MRSYILALAISGITQPAWAGDLHLVCLGAGSATKVRSTTAYATNSYGGSAWGQAIGTQSVPFDDQVNVEIVGDAATVRMPRSMLPPVHGGDNGWMKVNDLQISDREITGSVGVNFINKPKLRIDRMTGTISINGKAGDYNGQCQAYDPASAKPKF